MIDKNTLMKRLGKKKFVDFVLNNRDKAPTLAQEQHARRWGTNVKHKMCSHGVWIIENYEPKFCDKCFMGKEVNAPSIHVNFHEYFNMGTGTYGTNKEHRRAARSMGLGEAG